MADVKSIATALGHALAGGLAGAAGDDYVAKLLAEIEGDKNRKQRDKERAEAKAERDLDRQFRQEEREHSRARESQDDKERWGQALAPIYKSLGVENMETVRPSESIPLQAAPDGTLQSDPTQKPKVMSGNRGVDDILNLLNVPQEARAEVIGGGQMWAQADINLENQAFERDLQQREKALHRLAPIEAEYRIKEEVQSFIALEPYRFRAEQRSAALQFGYSLALQNASRVSAPAPKDNFEAISYNVAQDMVDDPSVSLPTNDKGETVPMSNAQYRQVLMGRIYQKASQWGVTLPPLGDRLEAINNAMRYYAPGLQRQTDAGGDLVGAAINALSNPALNGEQK
jgi:hypothetical protein